MTATDGKYLNRRWAESLQSRAMTALASRNAAQQFWGAHIGTHGDNRSTQALAAFQKMIPELQEKLKARAPLIEAVLHD